MRTVQTSEVGGTHRTVKGQQITINMRCAYEKQRTLL